MTSQSVIVQPICWLKLCWTFKIAITTRLPNQRFPFIGSLREERPVEPLNDELATIKFHPITFIMFHPDPRSGKSTIDQTSEVSKYLAYVVRHSVCFCVGVRIRSPILLSLRSQFRCYRFDSCLSYLVILFAPSSASSIIVLRVSIWVLLVQSGSEYWAAVSSTTHRAEFNRVNVLRDKISYVRNFVI